MASNGSSAPANAENVQRGSDSSSSSGGGAWIGLDWGTTNSAAAVYGRERGRCKWLRLPAIAAAARSNHHNKVGRTVPSVALFATAAYLESRRQQERGFRDKKDVGSAAIPSKDSSSGWSPESPWMDVSALFSNDRILHQLLDLSRDRLCVCIGAPASSYGESSDDDGEEEDPAAIQAARVVSLKRKLLLQLQQQQQQKDDNNKNKSIRIPVTPLGMRHEIQLDAVAVVACFLRALRQSSDLYLQKVGLPRKHLDVPGGPPLTPVRHVCLGVPAQADLRYRKLVLGAAAKAGFATATAIAESTAAAMAYGLFVGKSQNTDNKKTILVFDMGGGTTDVTIAERADDGNGNKDDKGGFRVVLTTGNNQLGGDDMDQAVLELVLRQLKQLQPNGNNAMNTPVPPPHQRAQWLRQCRAAKEQLCGNPDDAPAANVTVTLQGMRVTIRQAEFVEALQPLLQQTRHVVQSALDQHQQLQEKSKSSSTSATSSSPPAAAAHTLIHEVILIGGASAVPAVRRLLADAFPHLPELCLSVNANSAVAQGCAVAAAMESHRVPLHELESALMLDTNPHPIGVLLSATTDKDEHSSFVEILPANATLPARGFATFYLADPQQRGVTVQAGECVSNSDSDSDNNKKQYIPLGEFTFLLHRSDETISLTSRSVDIGMVLRTNGEFVVSVFDPHDPEHVRRRERHSKDDDDSGNIHPHANHGHNILAFRDKEAISREQILLMVACVMVFVLYIVAKIAFADEEQILREASTTL